MVKEIFPGSHDEQVAICLHLCRHVCKGIMHNICSNFARHSNL